MGTMKFSHTDKWSEPPVVSRNHIVECRNLSRLYPLGTTNMLKFHSDTEVTVVTLTAKKTHFNRKLSKQFFLDFILCGLWICKVSYSYIDYLLSASLLWHERKSYLMTKLETSEIIVCFVLIKIWGDGITRPHQRVNDSPSEDHKDPRHVLYETYFWKWFYTHEKSQRVCRHACNVSQLLPSVHADSCFYRKDSYDLQMRSWHPFWSKTLHGC